MDVKTRKRLLRQHPAVSYRETPTKCTHVIHNGTLKSYFGTPEEVAARTRPCKNPAHWGFTALMRSWTKDGTYCLPHLLTMIYADYDEEKRTRRFVEALKKRGDWPE